MNGIINELQMLSETEINTELLRIKSFYSRLESGELSQSCSEFINSRYRFYIEDYKEALEYFTNKNL